jgi:hypothetical protein
MAGSFARGVAGKSVGWVKGFELTVGYNYDSMVQLIRPDGTSSHWQFYSNSTFFPEGGSSQPNPNLTSSDNDSYNPNSRRQDGDGDREGGGSKNDEIHALFSNNVLSDRAAVKLFEFAENHGEIFDAYYEKFGMAGVLELVKVFDWGYNLEFNPRAFWYNNWDVQYDNGANIIVGTWGGDAATANVLAKALEEGQKKRVTFFYNFKPLIRPSDYDPSVSSLATLGDSSVYRKGDLGETYRSIQIAVEHLGKDVARDFGVKAGEYGIQYSTAGSLLIIVRARKALKTGKHSGKLADDLIASGYPRPPGYQAGHIVPTNVFSNRSEEVQKAILTAQSKFNRYLGEELRDAAINGFWAEAGHAGTHTDKFFLALGEAFKNVRSKKTAELALESLWERIIKGEFIP